VAVAVGEVAAAFGPADHRKPPDARFVRPRPFPGREVHIGLGPPAKSVTSRTPPAGRSRCGVREASKKWPLVSGFWPAKARGQPLTVDGLLAASAFSIT